MTGRDMIDNHLPLPDDPLAPGLHELGEPLLRSQCRVDGAKRKVS